MTAVRTRFIDRAGEGTYVHSRDDALLQPGDCGLVSQHPRLEDLHARGSRFDHRCECRPGKQHPPH